MQFLFQIFWLMNLTKKGTQILSLERPDKKRDCYSAKTRVRIRETEIIVLKSTIKITSFNYFIYKRKMQDG